MVVTPAKPPPRGDPEIIDKSHGRLLVKQRTGSKTVWFIAHLDGSIDWEYANMRRKKDALDAWHDLTGRDSR